MNEEQAKRKLAAILSADAKDYSRLMEDDEEATVRTITEYRELMVSQIQNQNGRVVDAKGDNVLAEFSSVVGAVRCAVEIQKELSTQNAKLPEHRKMKFRIGVNLGDVIEDGETIYGDGVNIAARLEALAEGGGICISGTAFDQIRKRLSVGYEYLGEQAVKNIETPVRVYRVLMEPEAAGKVIGEERVKPKHWRWAAVGGVAVLVILAGALAIWNFYLRPPFEPASEERMAFPLPGKPSIAVLPFVNMSEDPKQEYLADGITDNIIAALSQVPKLFVIARQSTFAYKGKPVKIKQVAEELGVRYVLEGSVQRSGDNLRVIAQFIDALGGHHLWSERYDRELKDLFAVQDEITKEIITALAVKLTEGEKARLASKGTENLQALLKYWQATEPYYTFTKQGNAQAQRLLEEVIALDPEFATPYLLLGLTHYFDVPFGLSKNPRESYKRAFGLLNKAIALDDSLAGAHAVLGWLYLTRGRNYDKAIAQCERALDLEPNLDVANFWMTMVLTYAGRHEEAVRYAEQTVRVNNNPASWSFLVLGWAYSWVGRYEEAIAALKKAVQGAPDHGLRRLYLTVAYSWAGRLEEARAQADEVLRINPNFSLKLQAKRLPFKNQADRERYVAALRRAGLPETPPLPLPEKPSVAVLPFVNMSGDPEQEYFSDGVSEEIITALSKTPKMFVIARTSSFRYKGKEVDVRTVGRELGVRYVLEGSFRKAGDNVRITAQLVDAKTGNHLWAERYDRELKDIFALQDEITKKIITAMQVELTEGEQIRIWAKGTENLDAYLKFLESSAYFSRFNKESNARSRQLANEAIALDPEYGLAYGRLGFTHWADLIMNWSESRSESFKQLTKSAQEGLALDESEPLLHALQSQIYLIEKQFEKALSEGEKAVSLSPSYFDAYVYLGHTLRYLGKPEEAIVVLKKAIRLNPFPSVNYYHNLGISYLFAGMAKEALATYKKAIKIGPNNLAVNIGLAVTYSSLGQEEEAREVGVNILKINPKFSVEKFAKRLPYKNEAYSDLLISGLKKAGLK
jgi:adenylate cyclase